MVWIVINFYKARRTTQSQKQNAMLPKESSEIFEFNEKRASLYFDEV